MNFSMVLKSLGILLICEAIILVPSLIIAIIYGGNDVMAFVYTIIICLAVGSLGLLIKPKTKTIRPRDGFAIVGLGWLLISLFGSLPFVFSGSIPSMIDAFFEASSGFTTTGASIMTDVEIHPHGVMFWRSFTHWAGGMGVLVLTLAILPKVGAETVQIMNAESPGPMPSKLVPKVGQTAKILYAVYIVITITQIILLYIAGMPLFDSAVHTFGSVGTGGFSIKNLSIGYYNSASIDIITTVFMLMCGANIALYYQALLKGSIKEVFKDEEFRFYMGVVIIATILIAINIYGTYYKSVGQSLRYSVFQVASIITTTGYATANFDTWPVFSRLILLVLMFIGGCAGSTAGAIKNIRILLLFKIMKRELFKIIHPRGVYTVKSGGKVLEEDKVTEVLGFFFMYMAIYIVSVLIVSTEGQDIVTTLSSVAATLGNVGPGLAVVGPVGNYSVLSDLSKIVLSLDMIIGRLEIYPILLLFVPSFWKRVNI